MNIDSLGEALEVTITIGFISDIHLSIKGLGLKVNFYLLLTINQSI